MSDKFVKSKQFIKSTKVVTFVRPNYMIGHKILSLATKGGSEMEQQSPWIKRPQDSWPTGSICETISRQIGIKVDPENRFPLGMEIWDQLNNSQNASWLSTLSVSQFNIYRLLLEWWEGKSQVTAPSEYARKVLSD